MTILPLTVLAYDGPAARAYLARLAMAGFRVERIVMMVMSRHPAHGKPIGRWLPGPLRHWYARQVGACANLYWPRRILATQPHLVDVIADELNRLDDTAGDVIHTMYASFDYTRYTDRFETVWMRDFRDPTFVEKLQTIAPAAILYTGGGLLRAEALNVPGIRFLHVHPGHLPDVRGADGLLWSILLRGQPGLSCFYMSPGIDEGAIITAREYPPLRFELTGAERPDDQTLYRAVFSFCDPVLRAHLLVRHVLKPGADPARLPSARQQAEEGTTYHFMHPKVRLVALNKLFPATAQSSVACSVGRLSCPHKVGRRPSRPITASLSE